MKNDPIVNVGDYVKLNKEAWDTLPKLTEDECIASMSKLKVLRVSAVIPTVGYQNVRSLTLEGLDKHLVPSYEVTVIQ